MFDREIVEKVWDKAIVVKDYDKDVVRKDSCGAWIMKNEYGNRDSIFGWEIDHVYPLNLGGDDKEVNLRPMHWRNNVSKGDNYPDYKVEMKAQDNTNVEVNEQFTINKNLQEKLANLYNQ